MWITVCLAENSNGQAMGRESDQSDEGFLFGRDELDNNPGSAKIVRAGPGRDANKIGWQDNFSREGPGACAG